MVNDKAQMSGRATLVDPFRKLSGCNFNKKTEAMMASVFFRLLNKCVRLLESSALAWVRRQAYRQPPVVTDTGLQVGISLF